MVKLQDKLRFRDDFPPVSTEEWEEKIQEDLKGADYNKKLIWRPLGGFAVRPYYRAEDLKEIRHLDIRPAEFPWVRGKTDRDNSWFVRQDVDARSNLKKANKEALNVLNCGVDSIGFLLDGETKFNRQQFEELLDNICIQVIELNFRAGHASQHVLDLLREKIEEESIEKDEIKGSVDYNPLGCLNKYGNFCETAGQEFPEIQELVEKGDDIPGFSVLAVDAAWIHNAGANIVQELAFALAMGNEYLAYLTDQGVSVDVAARNIHFKFGVGPSYFLEIAKFRAARMLWAKVVEAYGPSEVNSTQMKIHAETSFWNQTVYDPYVNMIRDTTEAMSASLGGADSISVTPYDSPFEEPTDFARRIARNTQIILKEEAHFDRVVDPAGGAYYIEELTQSIAEHSWKLFQEIENEGGYIEAFRKRIIQEKIGETANKRNMNIAMRKEVLVGINLYPNSQEVLDGKYDESFMWLESHKKDHAVAEPIKPYRGAEEMEELRLKTDKMKGRRPKVFMLTIGDKKMRRARAQFSADFFAAGGFEILDHIGFQSVDEGVQAALEKKPEIVVVCSSDQEYPEVAPAIYDRLKYTSIIVVAGYPKDSIEMLRQKGLRHFIHIKSNLVESLKTFQQLLGIK
ncbi:MAG: methylmalonyl-CoA mutase family protein [Bacteroidales bacterium]